MMHTHLAPALALALATACSGNGSVREHAEATAVATHCREHTCAGTPAAVNLGEGCYAVDDRLYQCATDGPGEASCFEVPPCAEVCDNHVYDGRGLEISTQRCEALWSTYRDTHRLSSASAPR